MSEQDVEFLRQGYQAFSRGDIDAVLEFLDPEIEVHEPTQTIEETVRIGPEGMIASVRNMQDVWDDYAIEPAELIDLGDSVLALIVMTGKGKSSGVPIEAKVAHLWEQRDGKAVRLRMWTSWEDARRAVGID